MACACAEQRALTRNCAWRGAQHGMARRSSGAVAPSGEQGVRVAWPDGALSILAGGVHAQITAAEADEKRGSLWKGCSPNKGRCWRRGAESRFEVDSPLTRCTSSTRSSSARELAQIAWCFWSLAGKVLSGAYFSLRAICGDTSSGNLGQVDVFLFRLTVIRHLGHVPCESPRHSFAKSTGRCSSITRRVGFA
jgi:hypothetical protein